MAFLKKNCYLSRLTYNFTSLYSFKEFHTYSYILASNSSVLLEFFNLSNNDIFTTSFFVVGRCPVYCRVFSSIFYFYTLNASSIHNSPRPPPVGTIINVSKHWQMSPGGQNCPWLRTTAHYIKTLKTFSGKKKKSYALHTESVQ